MRSEFSSIAHCSSRAQRVQLVLLQLRAALFLQLGDQLLGFALCLLEHALCLGARLFQLRFAARVQIAAQLFGLVAQPLGFDVRLLRQLALALGHLSVVFRIGDHILKAHLIVRQRFAGGVDQFLRQAQLARNLKGVGLAGHADGQAVGRAQGLHVEFHGGVFHAGRASAR